MLVRPPQQHNQQHKSFSSEFAARFTYAHTHTRPPPTHRRRMHQCRDEPRGLRTALSASQTTRRLSISSSSMNGKFSAPARPGTSPGPPHLPTYLANN
jgi:hypothetical protein